MTKSAVVFDRTKATNTLAVEAKGYGEDGIMTKSALAIDGTKIINTMVVEAKGQAKTMPRKTPNSPLFKLI